MQKAKQTQAIFVKNKKMGFNYSTKYQNLKF